MLFYSKKVKLQSGSTVKLSYSNFSNINSVTDENILPLKYAKSAFNYKISNGALKTGYGMRDLYLPVDNVHADFKRYLKLQSEVGYPYKLWKFNYFNNETKLKESKLVLLTSMGYLYIIDEYSLDEYFHRIPDVTLNTKSVAVNYNLNGEDVLIISAPDGTMGYVKGNREYVAVEKDENQPDICDMIIHYERLFAISNKEPRRLYFSDDLDPTNWDVNLNDAGFIDFTDGLGDLKRVFSFNDYLYILREFGISKVSAFGDQEQFYVNHCYSSNTKIFEKTACLCGNNLIFLARDGLYSFNGVSATKIKLNIENMFDVEKEYSVASFHKGKYFLACNLKYNDEIKVGCETSSYLNNSLIAFDIQTGEISITRGVDIKHMLSLEDEKISELVCLFNIVNNEKMGMLSSDGLVFGESLLKQWISPLTDLGFGDKRKLIKEIYLRTKYDCYVYVVTETATKKIKVYGKKGITRIPVNVVGNVVAINFESTVAEADISNPQIIINLLGAL